MRAFHACYIERHAQFKPTQASRSKPVVTLQMPAFLAFLAYLALLATREEYIVMVFRDAQSSSNIAYDRLDC